MITRVLLFHLACAAAMLAQVTSISGTDTIGNSRVTINNNFNWLNLNKAGIASGTTVPGNCSRAGDIFIRTDAQSGNKLYYCNGSVYEQVQSGGGSPPTFTANRAIVSDGSGNLAASSVTSAELGHLSGVTSAIQTQLDGKQAGSANLTTLAAKTIVGTGSNLLLSTGSIVSGNALTVDANGNIVDSGSAPGGSGLPSFDGGNKILGTNAAGTAAVWRTIGAGPSGALTSSITSSAVEFDIDTAVVPRKATSETITGLYTFGSGIVLSPQTAPASPADGQMWYDLASGKFKCRQGGATIDCVSSASGGHQIQVDGTPQPQRAELNVIPGTGITITGSDDAGNDVTSLEFAVDTNELNTLYARLDAPNTYNTGAKQIFRHSATTAGLKIGFSGGLPSVPEDGDVACDNTAFYPGCYLRVANTWERLALQRPVALVTGTAYTINASDNLKLLVLNNASTKAVTLPQASSTFAPNGWCTYVLNTGAGTATITPTTSTINGQASATLAQYESGRLCSDGSNYYLAKSNPNPAGGGSGLADPGANGIVVRTAPDTTAARTIEGTANEITVTNGDGVSGNPTLSLASTFDVSGKTSTKPVKTGTTPPATCSIGELFYDTDAPPGQNLYGCTSSNVWTLQGDGGGGGGLPSFDGGNKILGTNAAGTAAVWRTIGAGPSGALTSSITSSAVEFDIDTAVVPRKATSETITGLYTFGSGIVLSPQTAPASPADGQMWYDLASGKFKCRQGGATVDCVSGGGVSNYYTSSGSTGIGPTSFTPSGTLQVYDATPTTGTTKLLVRAGAGQPAVDPPDAPLQIQDTSGTTQIALGLLSGYWGLAFKNDSSSKIDLGSGISLRHSGATNTLQGADTFRLTWSSTSVYGGTKDVGLRRVSAGRLGIEDGSGTASNTRDLQVRSLYLRPSEQSKPTCDATVRGSLWFTEGAAETKDSLEVCAKDSTDSYAWRPLY